MMRSEGGNRGEERTSATAVTSMAPLFPRLHVNDAASSRGGPRAPPRNKMALYEQFSIPSSQRFSATSSSSSAAAIETKDSGNRGSIECLPVLSKSGASQGDGPDRTFVSASHVPLEPPKLNNDRLVDHMTPKSCRIEVEKHNFNYVAEKTDASGADECNGKTMQATRLKDFHLKQCRSDDPDDITAPAILAARNFSPSSDNLVTGTNPSVVALTNQTSMFTSAKRTSSSCEKHFEEGKTCDPKSRNTIKGSDKDSREALQQMESKKKHRIALDSVAAVGKPLDVVQTLFGSNDTQAKSDFQQVYNVILGLTKKSHQRETLDGSFTKSIGKGQGSIREQAEVAAAVLVDKNERSLVGSTLPTKNLSTGGITKSGSPEMRSAEKNNDLSDSSMVYSVPGLTMSPDDVITLIGPKHFLKARRAIFNQQKIFAVQVFELHRLIKVQKLMAASPNILLHAISFCGQSEAPAKTPPVNCDSNNLLLVPKANNDAQNHKPTECSKDIAEENPRFPSRDADGAGACHPDVTLPNLPVNASAPVARAPADSNPSTWPQPPPNQWLIPVMSPSEGLVYKPCITPCPPAGSIMAPFFPTTASFQLPTATTDGGSYPSGNSAVHPPQNMITPPMAMNYLPPFGHPGKKPIISSSATEQMSHFSTSQSNSNTEQQKSRCLHNKPVQRNRMLSGGILSCHASGGSRVQGSTASSPFDSSWGDGSDTWSTYLMAAQASSGSQENSARAIKVVPHNAKSASESVARIFHSLRKEKLDRSC